MYTKKDRELFLKILTLGTKFLDKGLSYAERIKFSACLLKLTQRLKEKDQSKLEQIEMNFDGQNL